MAGKKNRRLMALAAAVVLLGSPYAASGQVPDTGDADEPSCNPRSYTDLGNGIVRDNVTGLMWQQATAPGITDGAHTWQEAADYCAALTLGDYTDWRLPTLPELTTLVDNGIASPGPTIDTMYFPDAAASAYWSATANATGTAYAWFVKFDYGTVSYGSKTGAAYYVRAVRGEISGSSFTDNGDGTVADSVTGLVWEQATGLTASTWEQAQAYCQSLTLGEQRDWRLPTRNELQTIVDYSRSDPAASTDFFPDTVSSNYWCSTGAAGNAGSAWRLYFGNGNSALSSKTNTHYVRAVRAGRCGPADTSTTTTTVEPTTTAPATSSVASTSSSVMSSTTTSAASLATTTTSQADASTTTTTADGAGPCAAETVLGGDNPLLENLRLFRDTRLARSAMGQRIIQVYYHNAGSICAAFDRSPALRAAARWMLEAVASRVGAASELDP